MFVGRAILLSLFAVLAVVVLPVNVKASTVRGERKLKGNNNPIIVAGGGTLGTPDGSPPSFETVCEQYGKKAKGLCKTYCELKDCEIMMYDEYDDMDNVSNSTSKSKSSSNSSKSKKQGKAGKTKKCDEVKEQFVAKSGQESFPCERCPCWEDGELMQYFTAAHKITIESCVDFVVGNFSRIYLFDNNNLAFASNDPQDVFFENANYCVKVDGDAEKSTLIDITANEAKFCLESIVNQCDRLGLDVVGY